MQFLIFGQRQWLYLLMSHKKFRTCFFFWISFWNGLKFQEVCNFSSLGKSNVFSSMIKSQIQICHTVENQDWKRRSYMFQKWQISGFYFLITFSKVCSLSSFFKLFVLSTISLDLSKRYFPFKKQTDYNLIGDHEKWPVYLRLYSW